MQPWCQLPLLDSDDSKSSVTSHACENISYITNMTPTEQHTLQALQRSKQSLFQTEVNEVCSCTKFK